MRYNSYTRLGPIYALLLCSVGRFVRAVLPFCCSWAARKVSIEFRKEPGPSTGSGKIPRSWAAASIVADGLPRRPASRRRQQSQLSRPPAHRQGSTIETGIRDTARGAQQLFSRVRSQGLNFRRPALSVGPLPVRLPRNRSRLSRNARTTRVRLRSAAGRRSI